MRKLVIPKVIQISATELPYPDNYFDAVFTDPPYYDNVPYEILLPKVSKKEQKNIEELYGSPKDYNESEFVDMTDWIKK